MKKRILAIASGGGHWEQLMLLRPALEGQDVAFATTLPGLTEQSGITTGYIVSDCNRDQRWLMIRSALEILQLLFKIRPEVVISTGALPGLIAVVLGKKLGARTVWIDSIANAEDMSLAGHKARNYADLWLSQWPDVARKCGAKYLGSVL